MKRVFLHGVTAICLLLLPLCALAAHSPEAKHGEAIVLVAFGTSVDKARSAYENVEAAVRAQYPNADIRWAWSARSLLRADPASPPRQSTEQVLAALAAEGVKQVRVLSLHVLPGAEYHDLVRITRAFAGLPKGIRTISLSPPLLHDTASLRAVAQLLLDSAPKARATNEALLYVGHGARHAAGAHYAALQHYLRGLDKNAYVGTIEDNIPLDDVLKDMKANGVRKVWLAPLMTVAGDHAMNDLFGADAASWRQRLIAQGMQVEAVPLGLGDNPAMTRQWVQGLADAPKKAAHPNNDPEKNASQKDAPTRDASKKDTKKSR